MKLKNTYDDHSIASDETGLECPEPTLTQQHDEHDSNINNIVATYMRTGELKTHNKPPLTEDFSMITSVQDAMDLLVEAKTAFMEQPANVRARFNNDPALFVEFCSDENNRDEMRKLGLLNDAEIARYNAELAGRAAIAEANQKDAEAYRKAQEGPKS